jgi:hypothetical protein
MSERVAQGRIVLIGSGEIGPSMAPMHRALMASLPARSTPPSLVALDGSYDFQTNRAEMGEKIAIFFRSKVGVSTTVVGLPETERPGADLAPTAFSATLAALDAANLLFLGPGSPSRALFRWAGTPIVDRLVSRIHEGATLITSSAAAAASGESAIPVYEIYKAGLPRCSAFALRSCRTGTTRKARRMTPRAASLATSSCESLSACFQPALPSSGLTNTRRYPLILQRTSSRSTERVQ